MCARGVCSDFIWSPHTIKCSRKTYYLRSQKPNLSRRVWSCPKGSAHLPKPAQRFCSRFSLLEKGPPQAPSAGLVVLAAVPVCDLSWGSVGAALMALLGHNPSFLLSDFVHGFFSLCSLMSKQLHKALRGLFGYYYKNYFSSTAAFETPRRRFLSKLF